MSKSLLTKLKIFILGLNEVDNKCYDENDDLDQRDIYFFKDTNEYYQYFFNNLGDDYFNLSNEMLSLPILFIQNDGTIVASSDLCNHIIHSVKKNSFLVKKLGK